MWWGAALLALACGGCLPDLKGYACDGDEECFANEVCVARQCSPVISPDQGGADMGGDQGAATITVRGEVRPPSGSALGAGAIVCTDEIGGDRVAVGADGMFSLRLDAGEGGARTVVVQGWAEGFEAASETLQVDPGKTYQITLNLTACASATCASPCQ